MAILQDMASLQAQLDKLQAENEALKAKAMSRQTISMKVSEKGCLSVYGLGRFPVTLYGGQWQKLLSPVVVKGITDYIEANHDRLAWKD